MELTDLGPKPSSVEL